MFVCSDLESTLMNTLKESEVTSMQGLKMLPSVRKALQHGNFEN